MPSPEELAKQFRKPEGELGKQLGIDMNAGNKHITLNSYKVLEPGHSDHVLEIGMGNGLFVKDLLGISDSIQYTGADFSQVMVDESIIINSEFVNSGRACFECASIENLPFKDNCFDCIVTVNTIYFWPDPEGNAKELFRVLKSGGRIVIAYRSREFMDKLELTKYGFTRFEPSEVEQLLNGAGFNNVSSQLIIEPEFELDGIKLEMEGLFTTGKK